MPPEDLPKLSTENRLVRGRSDVDSGQSLSQSLMVEMQLNSESKRLNETTLTKLMRQADVVLGGTAQGTVDSSKHALTDPATLVKFGSSAVLATGLTLAQGRAGLLKLSAQVGSLALAGAFAKDVYGKGEETVAIMQDTWKTPENAERNKRAIGETLGPFVVDFGIFGAGGMAGIGAGKVASRKFFGTETPSRAFRIEPESTLGLVGSKNTRIEPGAVHSESLKPGLLSREPGAIGGSSSMVARPLAKQVNVESAGFKPSDGMTATQMVRGTAENQTLMPSRGTVEIPVVEAGTRAPVLQKFPAESPIAKIMEIGSQSVGKVEVVAVRGDKIEALSGSAVSLGEGKLVTNYHVVENASDITLFDALGRPHKAHTVAFDPTPDLAIIQLRDRSSFDAFLSARFKNKEGYKAPDETSVVAVGHFDSHNSLTASPAVIPHDLRQTPLDLRFRGSVETGNSGGALFNMDAEVIGIVKSGFENGKGMASPTWHIDRVQRHGEKVAPPVAVGNAVHTSTVYSVENVAAARANVSKLFDTALEGTKPPEFFHSKVKRVDVQVPGGKSQELVLQTQLSPNTREVTVQPISFDGKPITAEVMWFGTSVPIVSSRLSLRFEPGLGKAEMKSINDPLDILPNAFNYRSEGNYLASLVPTTKLGSAGMEQAVRLH